MKKIGFIGLGLIGGSLARAVKRVHPDLELTAFDTDAKMLELAEKEHIITCGSTCLDSSLKHCDILFLCTPVSTIPSYLEEIKPFLWDGCIVTDVGSVKGIIHDAVKKAGISSYFIGGHPMAGSEKTGFQSANDRLFENAYYLLTPSNEIPQSKLDCLSELLSSLGALPLVLSPVLHDEITAAVSHVPHIIASSLVNLLRQNDTPEGLMKLTAAGGFKDITRIASSSSAMWQQICLSNQSAILKMLDQYIALLEKFRSDIAGQEEQQIYDAFSKAKDYRNSIPNTSSGPIQKVYELYCDLADEVGGIAMLATSLACNQISIKNIGIIHNREFTEGVLRIEFYHKEAAQKAAALLKKCNYTIYER